MKIRILFISLLALAGIGLQAQNVGIGVPNPKTRLDIDGDIRIGRHTTDTMVGRIKYNPSSKIFEGHDSTVWIPLQSRWSAGTGNNIHRTLGNVGIGWTDPTGRLGIIADGATDNITLQKSSAGVFMSVFNSVDPSWPFQMSMGTNSFGDSYASLRISTGWPNQLTIHKSGRLGFGTDVPGTAQGMESCLVEFADDDPFHSDWGMRLASSMFNGYPAVIFAKSAGTIEAPTAVSLDHMCGGFLFTGYDGVKYSRLGEVRGEVDGNVTGGGTDDMPGRIVFWTKLDNTGGDGVERMRITNRGYIGMGTQAPAGILDVRGGTATSGSGTPINLYAQNGYASGNTNGGGIILMTGSSNGTGTIGNIGIGTATPQGYLDIRPANPVPPTNLGQNGKHILIYAQNAAITGTSANNYNGGNIILFPGAPMNAGTNGYVGVNTTTPIEMLDVNGRIAIQPTTAPGTTTNRLYNVGGTLYWNGSSMGGLPSLASGNIIVGDASGIPTAMAMTGDVTISNTGVTTIEDNSVDGTDIALGSDAQGDVMYYNGTDWARLGAGTNGHFLKTQGAGANPVWAADNNSGGTVTSVAAGNGLNFTTITGTGSVTLGTPSNLSGTTTNSVSGTTHTHAITMGSVASGNADPISGGSVFTALNSYLPLAGGTMTEGANIVFGTTTGTKLGTATNQKIGFYNATPVIQQTGSIKTAMTTLGLMASPTIPWSDLTSTPTTLGGYGITDAVASTRTISTTSPLTGGGDLSANRTFAINNAAADGTNKGAATFTAADFNDNGSGLISIDYTNAQAASSSTKGFLTSADWTTFNNKGSGTVTSVALSLPGQFTISGSPVTGTGTLTASWNTQTANQIFAGPASGAAAAPTFRALVDNDLPDNLTASSYLPLAGGTMTGKLNTLASAAGGAGLNLPHGAAPTTPTNGDLWTTTAGVYARINGATVGPFGAGGGISGSGTADYLPRWTGATALGNSLIRDNATRVAIGNNPASTTSLFHVEGNISGAGNGAAEFLNTNGNRMVILADPTVAGYFDAGGVTNQYALQLNGDFYNQESSTSQSASARTATTLKATASVVYRAGSSIIINTFYNANGSTNGATLTIKLTRQDGAGAETAIAYSATRISANASPGCANICWRETGLTDGNTITYRLYVTLSSGTLSNENYSLIPMLFKE